MGKVSLQKRVVLEINKAYSWLISRAVSAYLSRKELGKIIKVSRLELAKSDNEKEWKSKWGVLSRHLNANYYRVYSQYIGKDINIVPDDLCHNVIEPLLNPVDRRGALDDKCLFDNVLSRRFSEYVTPKTILRSMDGLFLGENYERVGNLAGCLAQTTCDRLIAKPSLDSSSGKGVLFFERNGGVFKVVDSAEDLTEELLRKQMPPNFIMQECLLQSEFMTKLCPTSVNTIRVAVYRSVVTNEVVVLNSIMRIGNNGALVDNAHAGGCFIGVSPDGNLGKYLCNQYGQRFTTFNGIDFAGSDFCVPHFDQVLEFSKKVGECVSHLRLLQLDVAIDKDNIPVLIEYNIRGFAPWLYQFTTGSAFGDYTDEIIDYCQQHKQDASRVVVSF